MPQSKGLDPVIKWSGSKRNVALLLAELFAKAETFYDPFVGSGAVLPFRSARHAIAGDIISELINLWRCIQTDPDSVAEGYKKRWEKLQKEGYQSYYEIRNNFNKEKDPIDFLFLTRTCVNGLVRFNSKGEFNNSLHHSRPGIAPERLNKIIKAWNFAIQDVEFNSVDYRETLQSAKKGDVVFLDPPYAANRGRYKPGAFDLKSFFLELDRLNSLGVKWVLTFDGTSGVRTYEDVVPESIYKKKLFIKTGNAPFARLMGKSIDLVVESVYVNFQPSTETLAKFYNFSPDSISRVVASEVQENLLVF